jgi:hemoglobin
VSDEVTAPSLFSRAGGMPFFERLVDAFYARVASDAVWAPLYPEHPDFAGARHRLTLFLAQYWGGPTTYSEERGHPALRMRHMRFHLGPRERDHWLEHMGSAVAEVCDDAAIAEELMRYFVSAAEHLRNDTGLPISAAGYPR